MTNTPPVPPLDAVTFIPSKFLLDGQRIQVDEYPVVVSLAEYERIRASCPHGISEGADA